MSDLIKINYDDPARPAVSGRELHEFLEVQTPYKKWFDRMAEYGFSLRNDYIEVLDKNVHNSTGGRPATDHAISIDMAKEICMLQRTERGKQARQYFIQLEKAWNSPEQIMARALKLADREIMQLRAENEAQRQLIQDFEPVRQYVDQILSCNEVIATSQIAADYGLSARRLNKILHEAGLQYSVNGQWILYRKHMGQGYTKSKTINIIHSDGHPGTRMMTYWTQKGRLRIHEILTAKGIQAVMDQMK